MAVILSTHNFSLRIQPDAQTIVEVSGELDLASAPTLQAALAEIEYSSIQRVLLDLTHLSFIDARGLRVVVALHATCQEHGVVLTIRRGPRGVQRVFELTQTDRLLVFEPV